MGYPDENGDVVQALEWLKGRGASKLYLVGDSSGKAAQRHRWHLHSSKSTLASNGRTIMC